MSCCSGRYLFLALRRRSRLVLLCALLLLVGGVAGWVFWPDYHLQAAERALARGDLATARWHLGAAGALGWDSGRRHLLAARLARQAGRLGEAEEELSICQRLQGGLPEGRDALTLERALVRAQRGDREVDGYLLARVQGDDPEALTILEVLIQQHVDGYELFDALDCLNLYLERKPDDVQALLGRAFVWERLFFYPEAVRDYRRAVQVNPQDDRARLRLGQALLLTGPAREAREQFEEWQRRHPDAGPDSTAVRLGLARSWRLDGQTEKAQPVLDALLAEQPRHVGALTERGQVALDQGDRQRAEQCLRQAVELAPFDRQAVYNLYHCLQQGGKPAEIEQYRAQLERLDADLKRLGELTRAVLKTPGDPALRVEAAAIFLRSGEEQEGLRWLGMALRLDPACRAAHEALAEYYERHGEQQRAARHRLLAQDGRTKDTTR
jgi:tetratricopeptide (TPR) repeat protein